MKYKARFDPGRGGTPFVTKQQKSPGPASPALLDLNSLLTEALALHQANRLAEAEQLYRKILQIQFKHFDSLHLLGIIHLQRGEFDEDRAH